MGKFGRNLVVLDGLPALAAKENRRRHLCVCCVSAIGCADGVVVVSSPREESPPRACLSSEIDTKATLNK